MIKPGASAKRRRQRSGVPGKCGIVRLYGRALTELRNACWLRDEGRCQSCDTPTYKNPLFDGDPMAFDMAHIRNKRMYGDVLENVRTLCHHCHSKEHSGRLKRPI